MKLLLENWKKYLNEASLSGRALEHYATLISREVVKALKDDTVKNAVARRSRLKFRMGPTGMEFLENLDWVRDVNVDLSTGGRVSAHASYEFTLDGTDEQRKESDINLNILLPTDYDDSVFSELIPELKDTIRHELEHSSQPTEMLMKTIKEIPEREIWKTLQTAEGYYMSEAEVKAHVVGIYKKAKMLKEPVDEVIDDFLMEVYSTGLSYNYTEEELSPLMKKIRELWRYYMASRYPHAELDWGEE